MLSTLVRAQLKAEIRDKTILVRSLPFVGIVLFLFAYAFDPDRGILQIISAGLWWVTTVFASMFLYVKDAHNKKESAFLFQFGIDPATIFLSRVIVNTLLTLLVNIISGIAIFFLFSPSVNNIFIILIVALLTTIALATLGAVYSPMVSKLHDSGQLLSVVIIPVVLPALLAAIKATESALDSSLTTAWRWIALLAIFVVLYLALGLLSASSHQDDSLI